MVHIGVGGRDARCAERVRSGTEPRATVVAQAARRRGSLFYALVIVGALMSVCLVVGALFALNLEVNPRDRGVTPLPRPKTVALRFDRLDSVARIANGFVHSVAVKKDCTLWS